MSLLRFFEDESHAKVYSEYRPTPPTTLINRLVGFIKEKHDGPLNLAVDLGCGNGQCTFAIASSFSQVIGTDISPAQITQARECCSEKNCKNVKFEAAPAENIPVDDGSVQLITICEAAHWMELPKVFNEARRVLAKNGVFSIIGYHLPDYIPRAEDDSKKEAIQKIIDDGIDPIMKYFPEEGFQCFEEYKNVTIPFSDFTREQYFPFERKAKLSDLIGCIKTYSPYQTFRKEEGNEAGDKLLEDIVTKITATLNEGRKTPLSMEELMHYEFTESFRYFVLMARA